MNSERFDVTVRMSSLTHIAVRWFVAVALPRRAVSTRHGVGPADMIALYEARVAARMCVVPGVATVAEVIYTSTQKITHAQ